MTACETRARRPDAPADKAAHPVVAATVVQDTVLVPAADSSHEVLLETGFFHAAEVPADAPRPHWLGLFRGRQGYYLAETPIRATREADPLEGADSLGWQISVPRQADRCLLLLPLNFALRPGPVDTLTLRPGPLPAGRTWAFGYAGRGYTLTTRGQWTVADTTQAGALNFKLIYGRTGQPPQLLVALPALDDTQVSLLWAGDLDHDQQPDFILDTTWHYNVSRPTLFLSSQAGAGYLRLAGMHTTVGC